MDNLGSQEGARVRELIEAAGATPLFLPPYSPDFNPIEMAFAEPKALLRKAAERTVDGLWRAIGRCIDAFAPLECANVSAAAARRILGPVSRPEPRPFYAKAPTETARSPEKHGEARKSRYSAVSVCLPIETRGDVP